MVSIISEAWEIRMMILKSWHAVAFVIIRINSGHHCHIIVLAWISECQMHNSNLFYFNDTNVKLVIQARSPLRILCVY